MPSLKDLRLRINSVKSTQKITSAMKMVAASKLRRAQTQAEAARPYAQRMERMLAALAASVAGSPTAPKMLTGTGADKRAPADPGDRGAWVGGRLQLQHRPTDAGYRSAAGGGGQDRQDHARRDARGATI